MVAECRVRIPLGRGKDLYDTMSTMSLPKTANLNHAFLVVDENRFVFEALVRLIGRTAEDANLVTLQGTSGSGKTHLVKEFLEDYLNLRPQLNYRFVNAGDLATQFMSAAQHREIPEFHSKFDTCECLVLDDVHLLEQQYEVQRFVTGLIDRVTQNGGVVIATMRKSLGELNDFSSRLVSRLRCGVHGKLEPYKFQSRVQLLDRFATTLKCSIEGHVLEFIAEELIVSPREMMAFVKQLKQKARFEQQPITIELARSLIHDELKKPTISLREIASAVGKSFNVTISDMRSKSRDQSIAIPRQVAMYLARELAQAQLSEIGDYFGGRSHSTVIHACSIIQKKMDSDPVLDHTVARIQHGLHGIPLPPK